MAGKSTPDGYWTKERVLAEARRHQTPGDWKSQGGGSRAAATKNGWYAEATAHMAKTVGSKTSKWTKEAVLADAQRYQSKGEWRKSGYAYSMAHRRGWLDEVCAHMTARWEAKWDKAAVLADARKFKSRRAWETGSSGAYASAARNGWYDEATAHMPMLIESWTKEKVIEDAKKYRTKGEWFSKSSSYSIAHVNGWIQEASMHMITTYSFGELIIYTYLTQHDIEFEHQKRYPDLKHKSILPFDFYIPSVNLLIEYNGIQHKRGWNGDLADAKAIQHRDELKRAYAQKHGISYLIIDSLKEDEILRGLSGAIQTLADATGKPFTSAPKALTQSELELIANLGKWTKDTVLASGRKFKNVTEWKKFEGPAYNKAIQMGWKDEATAHMTRLIKKSGHWTKSAVLESAKPFDTQTAWSKACGGAWSKAVREGWIPEATAHMSFRISKQPKG